MLECSEKYKKYFEDLDNQMLKEFSLAEQARKKNLDPVDTVESSLVKTMPEKVLGLISTVAPQIKDSNLTKRFEELEKEYGVLDWRVAMKVAEEISKGEICPFDNQVEAMEVGIRAGFAYITLGLVSAALEGFTKLEIRKRRDGKEYFCLHFSGPIRNAGGTAAAVCVLIADYVRRKMGYDVYDPDDKEVQRYFSEVEHYNDRCVRIQYMPLKGELDFLAKKIPLEISGDPTEKVEVPNFKNLPRIPTNLIRSGMCLIMSSCIPLKAPKLWKELAKWGKDFEMDQWNFLEEFITLQKSLRSKQGSSGKKEGKKEDDSKIKPNYAYIADLVGGRPVLGHPLAKGGLRLRYGRSRISGLSGQSIHPATMQILGDFIATGSQLKVERPGKASVYSPCDTIEGPIVKLEDDSVKILETEKDAIKYKREIKEILFVGDVLVCYGDFFDRAHPLVPVGYCEEWWAQELEKSIVDSFGSLDFEKAEEQTKIQGARIKELIEENLRKKPNQKEATDLSLGLGVPLHPRYTFHWSDISAEQFKTLLSWLKKANVQISDSVDKIVILNDEKGKRILELLGVPHIISIEYVVIEKDFALSFFLQFGEFDFEDLEFDDDKNVLEIVNSISKLKIRDKSGTYIGSRMGRPEKAKMRSMKGNPHGLFPVGEEGGRMRSFQAALEKGYVESSFPIYLCSNCKNETVYRKCEDCGHIAKKMKHCRTCGTVEDCEHGPFGGVEKKINFRKYFKKALQDLDTDLYPDLIKGIRGTINREKHLENMVKAILRAKHNLFVNKDGTIRYDCTEIACTHFTPREIGITVEDANKLGYSKDAKGRPLENEDQVCELMVQDIILPCCPDIEHPADKVFLNVTKFIDDLLVNFYGMEAYYNCKDRKDLLGHLLVGLAPHTSAGTALRIIGFSKTQGLIAHPMFHCAIRRDADGDEGGLFMLLDSLLNFSQKYLPGTRGSTMDAPIVLSSLIDPAGVDDMLFKMDVVWKYPLDLYYAALDYKMPWDVKIEQISSRLGKPEQYENYGYTHDNGDMNAGILVSSYKTLPTMADKVRAQMELAEKIRAVDTSDVASMVINKHFLKDLLGNLRKFSQQIFRCVKCNEKYRRAPLMGVCTKCKGKIIFTVSEGSVVKYLEPSLEIAARHNAAPYFRQTLNILKLKIESTFGKEKEKQEGLNKWFG